MKKLNSNIYYSNISFNNYNILDTANKQIINLIITKSLDYDLITADFIDLYIKIIINSNCSHHSFANYSMFIIYKKIYS